MSFIGAAPINRNRTWWLNFPPSLLCLPRSLPARPPPGEEHTVGGLAALAACGPERLRYGAPRDLLLGLKFISGTGDLISAGGRVVKNVAGYDLTRLLVGSAGTLGLITELTFRVSSVPPRCLALAASGSLGQCSSGASELLRVWLKLEN